MSEMSRCVILTALMAEAVPIINFYRLQKQPLQAGTQLFCSDRVDLIVCGLGGERMASGIKAYLSVTHAMPRIRWLNLGTAGTLEHAVGDLVWARSIGGVKIGQPGGENRDRPMDVISLNKPSTDYVPGVLFDMEAQACIDSLLENVIEFEPAHLFCAKVVSDNQLDPVLKKDKHQLMSLMQQHQKTLANTIVNIINT